MKNVAARNTEVREVALDQANEFLQEHHRAGSTMELKTVSLGLYQGDTLLAVAQFCRPRTAMMQKKYTTELLRLAFHTGIRIQGGASKLVTYYRINYRPADIFTYQDTTGEANSVYEKCGFTFVKEAKEKSYLIAPDKTLKTASRKEAIGIPYATRFGPDRITGSKLGEVFHSNGKRKTNIELFIDELGWHVEATSGDRIYEWVDPHRTYYTYKTTATDSDKYYIGVSHVKLANATLEDCLNDGYYGSGGGADGNKFTNWKKKHKASLQKEILGIYSSHNEAFRAEEALVGNKWASDSLCLNSTKGGKAGGIGRALAPRDTKKECAVHGMSNHIGPICRKCSMINRSTLKVCPTHGEVKHLGDQCYTCANQAYLDTCPTHGESKFQRGVCRKCEAAKTITNRECEHHGLTPHNGGKCSACQTEKLYTKGQCAIHGETTIKGKNSCVKCEAARRSTVKTCPTHGEVGHTGDTCSACTADARHTMQTCPTHGEASFSGTKCMKCINNKTVVMGQCPTHGETKFQGIKCSKCNNEALITMKDCSIHGTVKHRGKSCYSCISDRKKQRKLDKIDPSNSH